MLPCSWKESFGIECPTCGAQRSIEYLLKGDVVASMIAFPALIPLLLTIIFAAIHLFRPQRVPAKWIAMTFSFSAVLMLVNWIVKLNL